MTDKSGIEHYWSGNEGFQRLLEIEHTAIARRTNRTSKEVWTGVSLSGGGIRSASFCLGALQALARSGVLARIDYISTVSGGGYIGAGLQWLLCRDPQTTADKDSFPYGTTSDSSIDKVKGYSDLQYLRWHANYLLPGSGLNIFSALAVVIRTVFLSLAIWFPLIVLAFFSIQKFASTPVIQLFVSEHLPDVTMALPHFICPSWITNPNAPRPLGCGVTPLADDGSNSWPDQPGYFSIVYAASLGLSYLGLALLSMLSLAVAFISITKFPQKATSRFTIGALASGLIGLTIFYFETTLLSSIYSTMGRTRVPIDTVSFVVAVVSIPIALVFLLPTINLIGMSLLGTIYKNADYWLRRRFELWGGLILRYTIYTLIFASIPISYSYFANASPISTGTISILSGLASAVFGHLSQSKRFEFGLIGQTFIALAALVFLYTFLLAAYASNSLLFDPSFQERHYYVGLIAAAIVVISTIFGVASNSNTISLHRFYRDRLMELFMPTANSTADGRSTASFSADRLSVAASWEGRVAKPIGLYPIVNCNAILVNDPDPILASRGGANFAFTPLHLGGESHGWESCEAYERKNREVSLVTAIAASGAAANANSGYAGTGVTRNRAVSLVLMLFNIGLGVWIRRPSISEYFNFIKPTPFFPNLWYGPFAHGYKAKNNFVEISDGGHFENLGVYELVRRKVDLIIALDGEADKDTALPALVSLTRRIAEDFHAQLKFETNVDEIIPATSDKAHYPNDAHFAKLPCVKATIRYDDDPTKITTLIYIKASLIDEIPFVARGYRAQHPDYPNESTANQFYSPEQFDAYRELGYTCAKRTLGRHGVAIARVLGRRF